jgi:glycosyltransferase involved in cell wall biosynthesis
MLQFPEIVECLSEDDHLIYILEIYPNGQFEVQNTLNLTGLTLKPVFLCERKGIQETLPLLLTLLKSCLSQNGEEFCKDTTTANWLYQVAKNLLFSIRQERLGISRAPALMEYLEIANWNDPHKGKPPEGASLGPEWKDGMGIKLAEMAKQRVSRPLKRASKYKVAHVVPQIVDVGHAPSRLLESLLTFSDQSQFEPFIISTERLQWHYNEYPMHHRYSNPSGERGKKRLQLYQSMGITTIILNPILTFTEAAYLTKQILEERNIDLVVFHGPDVIHSMCTQITDVPIRVLFEHGTVPSYPGFDVAIVSSQAAADINRQKFNALQTRVEVLPFVVNSREGWEEKPYPLEQMGLPPDSLVMTTFSNHLNSRLGDQMSRAIAMILKRVPKAFYAPLGAIHHEEALRKIFVEEGVNSRVVFLDYQRFPSQFARSMKLYLNEFPFGSCLAMLDAMAAGCPVVSMYDMDGPQQARYGGEFMGLDRVITTNKVEDYVELACSLLTDPKKYAEWSEHAKRQYGKHADVPAYVKAFESILLKYLIV